MATLMVNDKYAIEYPDDNAVFFVDICLEWPHKPLTHPNVLAARPAIFEYKHERKNGSKFWTSKPGIEYLIAVPRETVTVLPEKTYSNPKVRIGDVVVSVNACGGTFDPGWADILTEVLHMFVKLPAKTIKALLAVSLPADDPRVVATKGVLSFNSKPNETERWKQKVAASTTLLPGYRVVPVSGTGYKNGVADAEYLLVSRRASKLILKRHVPDSMYYALGAVHVDWAATYKANNTVMPEPPEWNKL